MQAEEKIIVLQPWKYDFTHNPKTLNITLSASSYFLYKVSGHKSLHDVDSRNMVPERQALCLKNVQWGQVKGRGGLPACSKQRSSSRTLLFLDFIQIPLQ